MNKNLQFYMAGGLFTPGERAMLSSTVKNLEAINNRSSRDHQGNHVRITREQFFIPHEDGFRFGVDEGVTEAMIIELDFRRVSECDILIANIDGLEPDSGTAVEIGMAYALGKPVILWSNDVRKHRFINPMVIGATQYSIAASDEELHSVIFSCVRDHFSVKK